MTHGRVAALLLVAMIFAVLIGSAAEWDTPPEAVIYMEPEPGDQILAGVPVEFTAEDSYDVDFDEWHVIVWSVNGNPVSTEISFVKTFGKGNYEASLYVETVYGNDTVHKKFYVYPNDVPELEGQLLYYDPYDDATITLYSAFNDSCLKRQVSTEIKYH